MLATKSKKKPTKKTKQPDEWTEKKVLVWLRSALRSASRRYPPLYAALAAAKEPYNVPSTDVVYNARQKYSYRCAECDGLFSGKEVAIDHRVECGSLLSWEDLPGFASRLFCQQEDLDILCHDCHSVKTMQSKLGMTKEQATIHQKVVACEKELTTQQIVALLEKHQYNEHSNKEKRRKSLTELFTKQYEENK